MIDITGKDIAELSDVDLRSLIGLLCEAELRSIGLPTAGVTWGGHQNAKDGGIDVRVDLSSTLHKDNFIPRSKTGFQVKKPDMPYNSIVNEMRPNGELRQVIKDLIDAGGAYIIVSSQGSTSDSSLINRRLAIEEALSDYPNASRIKVDFYDRERIAAWVRSHPSLVLWIRDKIGRPIQGWKAYGNWARSPKGMEEEYMIDGHIRLHNSGNRHSSGLSAVDGINELREILHRSSSCVRLVGLSGVGKTRLLQALFDQRIGEGPLIQSQVFYCDIGDNPNPDSLNFAEYLISLRKPAILAVDNCPPELHRRLSSICTVSGGLINLITVEYDIREDQPEETEVFRLEPASTEMIKKIIFSRFKHVSEIDANTIAKFSGGNSRIAISLANTIQRGESLANLRDEDLFERLFQQRYGKDKSLLRTAEVCSLVYSFDCQTAEVANDELRLLGSLIGMSVREVYENISELKRRDLVQQRGVWRAVLPHAIANKLAKRALENIPLDAIYSIFEKIGSERLLKSFSRRLSYLHESDEAIEVSKKWLSKNGALGDVSNLNELKISLFKNIAPVNPELALTAIERVLSHEEAERFFSRNNIHYIEYTRLLRALAYDKDLFDRSVELLCRFALSESPGENNNSIRDLLKSLFYIYLSGTHATVQQRLCIISNLMYSNSNENINLSISLLSASLESYHFNSYYEFEFGARSRDYGYTPRNREDTQQWFKIFIEYSVTLAISNEDIAPKIKSLLAQKFRGLWSEIEMYDELEAAARQISSKVSWNEGWIAVRATKRFCGKDMKTEILSRLNYLDMMLKPTTLIEQAKLYIFSGYGNSLDLVDTVENEVDEDQQVEEITRSLGQNVAINEQIFKELLPEILSKDGSGLFVFGQGLAYGADDHEKMWQDFCTQLTFLEESTRNYKVLCGFLNTISKLDKELAEKFLNEAVTDRILASAYPLLQTSVEINQLGADRLKLSIESGLAPIRLYSDLAYGRNHESICDDDLCELLRLLSTKYGGLKVAVKILQMRIRGFSTEKTFSNRIISLGQELLLKYEFPQKFNERDNMDYEFGKIINVCFIGESAKGCARILCKKIIEAYAANNIYSTNYKEVIKALAINQPKVFLDVFLEEDSRNDYLLEPMFSWNLIRQVNPMGYINDNLIISWCEENPETRYPIVSSTIIAHQKSEKKDRMEWTPLALRIIYNSPNPISVLNKFKTYFMRESKAEIMQSCLCLILDLKEDKNSLIADWAFKTEKVFEKEILYTLEWQLEIKSKRNEFFE